MAQDNIKNLYDALKGEYDLGSEQEFRNSLKDANNRRNLYKAIENDYDLGSEDDFNRSLGYGNVSNATNAGNNSNSTAGSAAQQVVDEYDRTATDNGGRRPAQGGSVDVYMTNRGKVRGVTLPYDSPLRKQYPWLKDVPGDEQIYVDENGDPLYYYADADGRILSKEEAADMDLAADVANTPGRKPRKVPATFIELPGVEISAENRPWRERAGVPEGFGELDINEVPATWQERMQQQQWQSDAMAGEEASRRGDYSKHGIETIKRGNEAAKAREMARNEKWSRMYNVDSPQKAERLKDIETTMKALNGDEKAMNEMQFKTTSMNSQLRDRYDYARMTGKELKDPVLDMTQIGIAPKLERDENGNVVVNENGTPLVGNTTNPVRVNTQKAESERVEREDKERQIKVAEEELKKLIDEARQIESPDYIYMQDAMSPYADPRTTNASLRELSIAIKNKQEQIAGLRRELEGGNKGFIRGFADSLTDLDNITFGLNSLGDNLHTAIVSQQMRNGAKPDKYVEMMLDAMYKNNEVQQRLDENSTRAYRIGGMTGYMLPFMAQITVTGGYSGVAEIGTGLGLRWMERFAAKYGMDTLKKRMAANVIKGLGVGLGDIGAGFVSATTLGLGNTVNDALQRGTGQLGINDKGEYEFTNADDWWRATLKAVTSQTKEFATERFGEHLPGLRRLNVTLAKQGPRVRAISRALSGVTGTPAMRKVAKWLRRGGINGLGAEILEEEIGLPVDVALGDMTWEEAISGKTQGDIILGVPLSVGAMYSVGLGATSLSKGYNTVQYLRYKDRLNNADKTAGFRLTDDVWQPLKSKIDGTTNEGMGTMWDEIRKDDNLSVEEKRAVYDYTTTLMSLRGYNLGMMFNVREAARRKELFVNIKPTGNGQFGDEFDQFKGNAEDAAMFLVTKKGGVAKGVFHRDDVGDIDLAWGNPRGGLEHIIEKHIITYADFDSVESAMGQISDVIKDGKISLQRNGNYAVEKNGVRVILSKAQDGHFVVTAYDNTRNMESKIRSDADATRLRQSIFNNENGTPVSQSTTPGNKDSENFWNSQADAAGNDILSPEERENVHEDGMIHAAVLYPDAQQGSEAQEVFMTKGNIVLNADGTIDTEASDTEIYYKGADGQVHIASPDKFQSVAEPLSVEDYVAANRPDETDETNEPDMTEELTPGQVVNVNVGGQTYEATVQGTDGNGNVLVYYQDENDMARPATFTVDEIRNANRPDGVQPPVGGAETVADEEELEPLDVSNYDKEQLRDIATTGTHVATLPDGRERVEKDGIVADVTRNDDGEVESATFWRVKESGTQGQPAQQAAAEQEDDVNAMIDRAREGDGTARASLREYGIDWGRKGVYRFASKGEVDNILSGGRYDGRFGNGQVDATNSDTPTTAASAEYRITFKDGFDFNKTGTPEADRAVMKNAELGDGYVTGGYTLDDVARIERRNEDGSYEIVYDALQPIGRSLTAQEAEAVVAEMEAKADILPEVELNARSWSEAFDENNSIETPVGRVKMGNNQITKFFAKGREKDFGMVAPTLSNPDVVVEKNAPSPNAERGTKYLFIKTFAKPDGSRFVHFESVTVQKDGMEISVSSHQVDRNVIKKEMQNGKILHLSERLSPGSERYLTETSEKKGPDLVPTSNNNISSASKDIANNPNLQGYSGENGNYERTGSTGKAGMPTDEKGNPRYQDVPVEATIADLYDGSLNDEEVQGFIDANIADAQKKYDSVQKKAPKIGTNKAKYLADKAAWQEKVNEAKRVLDYWKDVNTQKESLTHTTPQEIEAAQAELSGQAAREEYAAMNENVPANPVAVASGFIRGAKITPESFRAETGYGVDEQRRFVGMIARAENGGKSIERLAEELVSYDNAELGGITYGGDTNAARNAILDALQDAGTRGELAVDDTAGQDRYVEARRAELDARYMEAYGMTYEDYLAYEEQNLPEMLRKYANFDEVEFYNLYADEIEQSLNARINEQGNDTAGEEPRTGGGNELLPGEGIDNARGSEGGTEQGTEVSVSVQGTVEDGAVPEETSAGNERELDFNGRLTRRRNLILQNLGDKYSLSDEEADNGELFYQNGNGSTTLAIIPDEIFDKLGLAPVPFKLTESMGWHVFDHHSKELKLKNISDAIDFVLSIINNVDTVRLGRDNSYIFSIENGRKKVGHRAVAIIVDSRTGEFMGIRTAGYESLKNIKERPLLWTRGTLAVSEDVATSPISTVEPQQSDEDTGRTKEQSNSPSSESKDTQTSANEQTVGEKIAEEEAKVEQNPTEAQKEAGNYKKGHVKIDGYDVTIENPKGSVRSGVDRNGQEWSVTMNNTYGYIRGTEGVDGDHIDVFLSDDPTQGDVYVIDQLKDDGSFDEHKVMYGFNSAEEARDAYLANYSPGWKGLGTITKVSKEEFKKWIDSSHRKTKPFAEYKSVNKDGAQNEGNETDGGVRFRETEDDSTHKQRQLEIINDTNPMLDDYHTGIRSEDDIKTMREAIEEARSEAEKYGDETWSAYPDITNEMLDEALRSGKITVYSSKPIVNGNFVTPSRMQASDYAGGGRIYSKTVNIDDVAWINTDEGQYASTDNDASGNIRFRFIGERGAARLDAAEEATTRLDNLFTARQMEQANNDKKARIGKLRDSKPVEITGEEYKGKYDLNRDSAKQWLKNNLRGEYKIDDTNETIVIGRKGVNKVTSHSMGNKAHLRSLVAVPEMLKKAIFITEERAEKENAQYPKYRYYVVGLKIGDADYTVKITIGVDENGKKYYDHALTEIEKGTLIDNIDALSTTSDNNQNAENGFISTGAEPNPSVAIGKDTKLQSILQTSDQENARKIKLATGWERGADGKWRYETPDFEYHPNGDIADVNEKFNEQLDGLTEENAQSVILNLGNPGKTLLASGIADKPIKLYGNKLLKKMRKHGFTTSDVKNLPIEINNPVAVFKGSVENSFAILTELEIDGNNVLASLSVGKGNDIDFNIISSIYGKDGNSVVSWIDKGKTLYVNKEKALNYLRISALIAEAQDNQELISAANIVRNFENPNVLEENLVPTEQTNDIDTAVADTANKLNIGVRVAHSVDEVGDEGVRRAIEKGRNVKGWYDTRTGEIVVYAPNATDADDAVRTVLHEGVAHYGLRRLVGDENFDTFLDNIYNNVDGDIKATIDEKAQRNGWGTRVATEEYLASLAEDTNFEEARSSGLWQKIKDFFMDLLTKAGVRLNETLTDNELRYILWRSYENLAEPGRYRSIIGEVRDIAKQHELGVGNYAPTDSKDRAADILGEPRIEEANRQFNEELDGLTEENADKVILSLGRPSAVLRAAGVEDKPMKLYGNKVIKKMKKHGFTLNELHNLPQAVANPIAVFNNYQKDGNRSVLTELQVGDKHILVSITIGKNGVDADFNIVSSVFGKGGTNIVDWINKGYATYINKKKALDYLHFSERRISEALNNQEGEKDLAWLSSASQPVQQEIDKQDLVSAANIVRNFENPSVEGEKIDDDVLYREAEEAEKDLNHKWQDEYDRRTLSAAFKFTEAAQDGMKSVSILQDVISKETDKPIKEDENVWALQNRLSSTNKYEQDYYYENYYKPLMRAVGNLVKAGARYDELGRNMEEAQDDILKYLISKHGIERNAHFRDKEQADKEQAADEAFNKKIEEWKRRELSANEYISVGKPLGILANFMPDAEIILRQKVMSKSWKKHGLTIDDMKGLPSAIAHPIFTFKSSDNTLSVLTELQNSNGENIFVAIEIGANKQMGHQRLEVNDILTIHGREVENVANPIVENNSLVWVDKEKGLQWLSSAKSKSQAIANETLVSATNIVRNFDNPKFENENKPKDYSGLSELYGEDDFEAKAQEYVDDFESKFDTADLWNKINAATKATLRKTYEAGLISRSGYEATRDMYQYYIPLRGWSNDVASEMYNYKGQQGVGGRIMKRAKGRKSLAENPLAVIGRMGQDGILQANKNRVKQRLYNLAIGHDTSLLSISKQWYVNEGTKENPDWQRAYPELSGDMGADEVAAALKEFDEKMKALKDEGMATQRRDGLTLKYHTTTAQEQQHRVNVSIGGREYNIYVNGNPRAAQAINGELRMDDEGNSIIQRVNRWLANVYTSLNPEFVVTNYERDAGFAAAIVAATETPEYQAGWIKNMAKFNPLTTGIYINHLISKSTKGQINPDNTTERYMQEFLANGGETGFTNMLTADDYKKLIKKEIKEVNKPITASKAGRVCFGWAQRANRVFEDATRFATYVTSREQGRSIDRSIRDAKEISLNFNTRGADGMKNDGVVHKLFRNLRRWIIFTNPSIQGLNKAGVAFSNHPVRSTLVIAGLPAVLGYGVAALAASILDGDDDEKVREAYMDLPKWIRRTNICLPIGGTKFVTIPLSYELRVSYGLGEMFWEIEQGMIEPGELVKETVTQLSDLLPLSFASGTVAQNLSPTIVRPLVDIIQNKDFTGRPIYRENTFNQGMPEYTKAYAGTAKWLTKSSEVLNNAMPKFWVKDYPEPDKYTPGAININPAIVEHLLDSYLGGLYTFPSKAAKTVSMIWDEDMQDIRNIPFLNRNVKDSQSGNPITKSAGDRYNTYMKEYRLSKQRWDGYRREANHGVTEFVPKLIDFTNSAQGQRMFIIDGYKKSLDELDKQVKDIGEYEGYGEDEERKRLKQLSNDLKQELVDKLDSVSMRR